MREERLAAGWMRELEGVVARIGQFAPRPETRARMGRFLRATVAGYARRNGWQLAKAAGDATPHGMQQLVASAAWDVGAVRDDLHVYVRERFGAGGLLVVDETAFLKKGIKSAGVQRQRSGSAGRFENCQIGVFLAYARGKGHAFLDRELFLPESWTTNRRRCRAAGVPDDVARATKPQLARAMLNRAFEGGMRPTWVVADEVFGNDWALRRWLESEHQAFVLAIRAAARVWVGGRGGLAHPSATTVADALPSRAWHRRSAGAGSKDPLPYQWAVVPVGHGGAPGMHALLVCRHPTNGERAYYRVYAPQPAALDTLVRVARQRWAIEQEFARSKQQVGLDQYEVRTYPAWYRFMTLALYAYAFLAVMRRPQR